MDVTLRDGLQNESFLLEEEEKLYLANGLAEAGFRRIEAGAFVNPKAVPQMAGTADLFKNHLGQSASKSDFYALIPNEKGYELAKAAGVSNMAFVMAVTEEMNQKNVRMSVEDSFEQFLKIFQRSKEDQLNMRLYLAVVFHCPFEGVTDEKKAIEWINEFQHLGVADLCLADTDGMAKPEQVQRVLEATIPVYTQLETTLSLHLHNTYGYAAENLRVALKAGLRHFDSAVAGLGGCPFAPGAKGNIASEDLVAICEAEGFDTGIDSKKLGELSQWLGNIKLERTKGQKA